MLYYIGLALRDSFGPLNVLTYNTVRAGGAAFTGFLISLMIGPFLIRWLRRLKVGQYIREEHVEDLHALHKKKAGTPTMGGTLIIVSTVLALFLWGRADSRLLMLATLVFCVLGVVGFIDDYIKLRRKHNKGLSAEAKFSGQIVVGIALGVYLVTQPITPGKTGLTRNDVLDWQGLAAVLEGHLKDGDAGTGGENKPLPRGEFTVREKEDLLAEVNEIIETEDLSAREDWPESAVGGPAKPPLKHHRQAGGARGRQRSNRLLLEAAFPDVVARSVSDLHTKVEIPGLKEVFVPLGLGYVLFVLVIIVGSSNAVNLTDGLDGLAIGAAIISLMAYTAIAYVVSRADWSRYLFLVYVPEASELFVFGAALLGTGMGFLWFNSHPAEVFMGDTGSLALGGAIGTMAVLTKQELLLIVVGGLFVIEAGSVILQVGSFKLRGKRLFRMAPLHHHFELRGWSESKVTIRFWILAVLFALMSLAALKLR